MGATGFQSDGLLSFRGHVHESGVSGDNYFFGVALLDVKDSSGNTLVFPQNGLVAGQLDFGSSDDDFQNDGFSQLLRDQWDTAKNSVENGRVQFVLHVSSNPFYVTETLVSGLFVLAAAVLGGYGASKCDWHAGTWTDPNTGEQRSGVKCEWS
jgi:hypothetical protein